MFSSGEPIEASRIAQALEVDIDSVTGALWELQRILDERKSGVCLLRLGSKYQLCSRIEYAQQVRSVLDIKKNAPLSAAASAAAALSRCIAALLETNTISTPARIASTTPCAVP